MSDFDLMTVRQMIDSGFGEIDSSCPVNFNMLGTVLFILARRMQLLKRHFKVQVSLALAKKKIPDSSFKLTEIKIHAKKIKKKARGRSTKVYPLLADDLLPVDKVPKGKKRRSAQKRSRDSSRHRSYLGKRSGDDSSSGMSSDDDISSRKPPAHRTGQSERHKDISPRARRKSAEKPTAKHRKHGKYSDEISPTERRKSGKYADDMSPAERRKAGKYADEKSPTERRKAGKYAEEMSPTERRKAGRYADEMSPTGRRKSGKYSNEMSLDERKKYSGKMSPAERRTGGKSTTKKSGSGKYYSSSDELSSGSAIGGRSRSDKHGTQRGKADAELYSQKDTPSRSKETGSYERKIRRHDTRYADDDDDEEQQEKIYVVTRTPSGREIREPTVLHPVVTQEQFDNLLARALALKKKLGITSKPTQWDDLRSTNLITNPKAALNMSVRLDTVDTRLKNMVDVLEQIARHVPELDVQAYLEEKSLHPDRRRPTSTSISEALGDNRDKYVQPLETEYDYDISNQREPIKPMDRVTRGQFNDESNKTRDGVMRTMRQAIEDAGLNKRHSISAIELKVAHLQHKFQGIVTLDRAIEEFGNKVFAIDEHLTFEMTNIQDNLTQMQLELEMALEKMNDALLAPKEDPAAVAQITTEFNEYMKELSRTDLIQTELKGELEVYSQNLESVEERIKMIRADKCTRDEMFEALDDKLTLKDINGMLIEDQFSAVNAEIKETLKHLYLAMFSKECEWQRVIDEVKKNFYECAESNQIVTLNESIRKEFTKMDKYVNEMLEILGPFKKPPTDKKVERDDNCLSCGAPAETKKTELSVKLWKKTMSTDDGKSVKLTAEETAELCITGQPIPHPLELDSFVCLHDCGDIVKNNDGFYLYITELKTPTKSNCMTTKNTAEDHETLQ